MEKLPQQNVCKQEFELDIEALASDGRGIGRYKNQVVFVPQVLPGQKIRARVVSQSKKFLEAKAVSILTHSQYERPDLCIHSEFCGGCTFQKLSYQQQLHWKQRIVDDALKRIGNIKNPNCPEIMASPKEWRYRNKMEFVFAPGKDINSLPVLGLRISKSHQVIPIKNCLLTSQQVMDILGIVCQWVGSEKLSVKSEKHPNGYCRFLVVRESQTGECLVEFIVNKIKKTSYINEVSLAKKFCQYLRKRAPYVSSVIFSYRSAKTDIACSEAIVWYEGTCTLKESIGHINLTVKYNAFFQVNTVAAKLLYDVVRDFAQLTGGEDIWDLYTGIGSIALYLAPFSKHVLGVDIIRSSIKTAKINAESLGYNNCKFEVGDIGIFMHQYHTNYSKPQLVVIDPPRAGLDTATKEGLCSLAPSKCIYVSCNPGTLARDIAYLSKSFNVLKTQAVDLFPQTPHVETVSLLEYRKNF